MRTGQFRGEVVVVERLGHQAKVAAQGIPRARRGDLDQRRLEAVQQQHTVSGRLLGRRQHLGDALR